MSSCSMLTLPTLLRLLYAHFANSEKNKESALRTLAPSAVACDIFQTRECASRGAFFILKDALSFKIKKEAASATSLLFFIFLPLPHSP